MKPTDWVILEIVLEYSRYPPMIADSKRAVYRRTARLGVWLSGLGLALFVAALGACSSGATTDTPVQGTASSSGVGGDGGLEADKSDASEACDPVANITVQQGAPCSSDIDCGGAACVATCADGVCAFTEHPAGTACGRANGYPGLCNMLGQCCGEEP